MPSGCDAQGHEVPAGRGAHSPACSLGEEAGAGDHGPPRAGRPASHVEDYPHIDPLHLEWLPAMKIAMMHIILLLAVTLITGCRTGANHQPFLIGLPEPAPVAHTIFETDEPVIESDD